MASGHTGYHPLLLTRLLLYGYCVGVAGSRAIDEALWRHDVTCDTADFTAQYNLGAILQCVAKSVRRFRAIKPLSRFVPRTPSPTTPSAAPCSLWDKPSRPSPRCKPPSSRAPTISPPTILGAALAEIGEPASAKTHWDRALKLDPQNQLAQGRPARSPAPSLRSQQTINQEMPPIVWECGDQPPLLSLHPQVSFYARSRTYACKTNHHPACPERFST